MKVNIDRSAFKQQAKLLHADLVQRGVLAKLSDVQESLAVSFGFRNLAHCYGELNHQASRRVDIAEVAGWSRRVMFWQLVVDANSRTHGDYVWTMLPEGTNFEAIRSASLSQLAALTARAVPLPRGFTLGGDATVLESYVEGPNVERHGFPVMASPQLAIDWLADNLGYRIPTEGFKCTFHDRNDDGCETVFLSVALSERDVSRVRDMMFPDESRAH